METQDGHQEENKRTYNEGKLIIPYTAITNGKDEKRNDIVCFGEHRLFNNPVMGAKLYKVLSHKFVDADISVWMDGNIFLNAPLQKTVDEWLGDSDIALFRHYKSKDLDWELKWIKYKFNRRSEVYLNAVKQVEYYKKIGAPTRDEMAMGGFIIRRHNSLVERFNEAWWAEICAGGQRDQLSLPMVLKRFPALKVNRIDLNIKNNPFLRYEDHAHYEDTLER